MHIVRNATPLLLAYGQVLEPGEWLMQDDTAFSCAVRAERGTVKLDAWGTEPLNVAEKCGDGRPIKNILLIRSGAIGDLLLLSPCIGALKEKYPGAEIWLSTYANHQPIIQDFGVKWAPYPFLTEDTEGFDLIIPIENVIELATEQGIHATDAYAEALGVKVTDYKPVYAITDDEVFPLNASGKPRVGIQIHASSPVRGWPMKNWNELLQILLDRGWEIMLLGKQDGIRGGKPAGMIDCSSLSFREAAAVLATCDAFCGVDSAFFNLCPALSVPAIGIFGPVDWRTRVKEGSGQLALSGNAPCSPCGWTNARGGRQWPEGQLCEKAGHCVPMADVSPERVAAKIDVHRCK